jgi:hypothetical protein
MSISKLEREIDSNPAANAVRALLDARQRNDNAVVHNRAFFQSPQHLARLRAVQDVVDNFFRIRKGVYVNHRENRGRPFSTVKVDNPAFPNVSTARKQAQFYAPLQALGVEILRSGRTNSYILRVR